MALLLSSLLGYGLATPALRPVESMRAEAAAISATEPGRRLPVPAARDEISRLGETLNAMLDRLEAALERERGFVADAGHELRTPLALLKAELELALRRPRSEAELEPRCSLGGRRGRPPRAARRGPPPPRALGRGQLPLERRAVRGRCSATVADRFEARATAAGRAIEVEAPDGPRAGADRNRLEQALGDLVENALGHGQGTVQLERRRRDGDVELHVTDEGPGFPSEFLPDAFERFSRRPTGRARAAARGSASRSPRPLPGHTAAPPTPRTGEAAGDVWLSLPTALDSRRALLAAERDRGARGTRSPVVLDSEDSRAILIRIAPGQDLGEHQVRERAWVVVLDGAVDVEAGDDSMRRRREPSSSSSRPSAVPSAARTARGC